jgi:hypothetical protein
MRYLTDADIASYLSKADRASITESTTPQGGISTVFDTAEAAALEEAAGWLRHRWDVAAEYLRIGSNRNSKLVQCICHMTIFNAHSAITARNVPENRMRADAESKAWLMEVKKADLTLDLPLIHKPNQAAGVLAYGSAAVEPTLY